MAGLTRILTRQQVRDVDRRAMDEYGMAGLVLMENAGRGVVEELMRLGIAGPVVICCGKGNNAGDGFVIARHLDLLGIATRTLLFSDPDELRGDAAANFQIVRTAGLSWRFLDVAHEQDALEDELHAGAWLIDALLGTGAMGPPREPYHTVIERMNAAGSPIIAIDLPSGLDCDTGVPASATICAQHTYTFVAVKTGLVTAQAQAYVGQLHIIDIGVPRKLLAEIGR